MLAEEVSRLSAQLRRTEKRLEMTKGRIAELRPIVLHAARQRWPERDGERPLRAHARVRARG